MNKLFTKYHGFVNYQEGLQLQRDAHRLVSEKSPDQLILVQHPHVYTLGRRGKNEDILTNSAKLAEIGAEIHHTDRGGEVTYHGPGQLVGYPIINLRRANNLGPLAYVDNLEKSISKLLIEYGISTDMENRPTGVWVNGAKIASIGVRISAGTSTHGFALNSNTNLSYFEHIVACGMPEAKATSITNETGRTTEVIDIFEQMAESLASCLEMEVIWQ
tara:strand:- start:119 stop:769 length:651 start_codon:yes stop_codon:yes gene_type:complete